MIYSKYFSAILLGILIISSNTIAADSDDKIQLLIKQKQFQDALILTEEQLLHHSSNIKLQFMRGLILMRLNRYNDAEQTFIQLINANPELPEPYNNLSIVYAEQGNYLDAEKRLKDAIRIYPDYTIAHENLGDIYIRLASKAYHKVLALDSNKQSAREKLSLINKLTSHLAK